MNDSAALHKSQAFQRFQHGNVTIYNHREDAEEPAEDTNHNFFEFLDKENFYAKTFWAKKNCLYKGFIKPSRSYQPLKVTKDNG